MSVTIKYKGNTIASANTDTTKTIKTSGKYCEADIVVENVQDGGITPSGSVTLTSENTYDVTDKASAIVDFSTTRANLAEAVTAKGVDTLPTSSFDTIATNIGLIEGGGGNPNYEAVKYEITNGDTSSHSLSFDTGDASLNLGNCFGVWLVNPDWQNEHTVNNIVGASVSKLPVAGNKPFGNGEYRSAAKIASGYDWFKNGVTITLVNGVATFTDNLHYFAANTTYHMIILKTNYYTPLWGG